MALGAALSIRVDPVLNHNFLIALVDSSSALALSTSAAMAAVTQVALGGFTECSGLDINLDVEEYMEGGGNGTVLRFPTRVSWPNITLKSGLGISDELWSWPYGFTQGRTARRDGVIVLMNNFRVPHNIWFFRRGLPVKYSGPTMNAGQSAVAIHSLEIAHEGIYQVPGVAVAASVIEAGQNAAG